MPLEALIRDYRPQDLAELWTIDQICFPPGISYSRRELAFYIGRKRAFTLIAEKNGRIVGFLVADRERKDEGHIITIDVLPEMRRSRLGSKLMVEAESRLRAAGCSLAFLETAVDNAAAISFYKRRGYAVVGTIPRYYLGSIDALVLAKELSADPEGFEK